MGESSGVYQNAGKGGPSRKGVPRLLGGLLNFRLLGLEMVGVKRKMCWEVAMVVGYDR